MTGPNQVFESVRTVLAVRDYLPRPIPKDLVRRIVESARLTGSSMNGQPWYFIVVQDPATLRKLGAAAKSGPYIAGAPLAVAVGIEKESKYGVSDASRAIQSMVLTAWSEGVGSNWVGFGGLDAAKNELGVPANIDLLAILPFGYPAKPVGKGLKRRKALSEVAHRERFGQPFE